MIDHKCIKQLVFISGAYIFLSPKLFYMNSDSLQIRSECDMQ